MANNKVKEIEKRIAVKLSGCRCILSGAKWFMKSDVVTNKFQVEVKTTQKDLIVIRRRWLDKLMKEVRGTGRIPVLYVYCSCFEAYLVKDMYLLLYGLRGLRDLKCNRKIDGNSYMLEDADVMLDFNGDKWVVMSEEEFMRLYNCVCKEANTI